MLVAAWRLVTILLTALTMGLAFCHLMEMPARLEWDAALWVTATAPGGLYRMFGTIGAVIDIGAWIAAVVLVFLVRARPRRVFWLTAVGAALLVVAHVAWWLFVAPVNAEIAGWTPETIPAEWTGWRDQWEFTHAVRAVLQIGALAALLLSVLVETVVEPRGELRSRAHA